MVSISSDMTTQVNRLTLALSLEKGGEERKEEWRSGKTRKLEH
jgi:hypothetical protein